MPVQSKHLIFVVGPTAIGKTSLGVSLAEHFKCPIISADSRQIFKEMSIGTAKPSTEEMRGIKHYFIDSHSIHDEYNVGKFEEEALCLIEDLFKTHDQLIVVGGSGLYVNAIADGLDNLPKVNTEIRNSLKNTLEKVGITALQEQLKILDPEFYTKVDINNPQRVSRALEVCLTSGKTYSSFRSGLKKKRNFETIKVGLQLERPDLYNNINLRVEKMVENGLLNEVKSLIPHKNTNALNTVGYKELFDHLEGNTSFERAVELIQQNSRRFAKRQITWFKKYSDIKWFHPKALADVIAHINSSIERKNENTPTT